MHFDLVHGRDDGDFSQQPCQVLGHEVADADRPHPAVRQQLLERPVGIQRQVETARQRLMQQQQVEALDAELAGALVECVQRVLVAEMPDRRTPSPTWRSLKYEAAVSIRR